MSSAATLTSDPRTIPGPKDKPEPQPGPTDPGPDPAPATPAPPTPAAPPAPEPADRDDVATDTTPDDGQPTSNEDLTDPGASSNNDAHPL